MNGSANFTSKRYVRQSPFLWLVAFATAFPLSLPAPAEAGIILEQGWQNLSTWVQDASSVIERRSYYGIPGLRTFDDTITTVNAAATVSATQSAVLDLSTNTITFSGNYTGNVSGSVAYSISSLHQYIQFQVVDQPETVTASLITNNVTNFSDIYNQGFRAVNSVVSFTGFNQPATLETVAVVLAPGTYRWFSDMTAQANWLYFLGTPYIQSYSVEYSNSLTFTNLSIAPGFSEDFPRLPDGSVQNPDGSIDYEFSNVPTHTYVDPLPVSQFDFMMTGSSLFTSIDSFPTRFSAPFEVIVDGMSLGFFGSNESVDFQGLLGHGVMSFSVRNIQPSVDGENPLAFPIQLGFDTETASFVMTAVPLAVPEPGIFALLATAIAQYAALRYPRRTRHSGACGTLRR